MKLSKGAWSRMNVQGHSADELWLTFRNAGGGSESWSQAHVGEVVVYQNGDPVNIGPCKTCGGKSTVTCPGCRGQGTLACELCSGKKIIPIAWTPTDNPRFNSQPDLIRLKDGRAVLGRVAGSSGDERIIVTRDRKVLRVKADDFVTHANPSSGN